MIIDLIRHTTPNVAKGICYGQTDLELASNYENEFKKITLKTHSHYDVVITSPLQRCLKLALSLPGDFLLQEPRIKEYNFGDWEMLPWSELNSEQALRWMQDFTTQSTPNGESMQEMQTRVMNFWEELLLNNHKKVAVVTHSGVQRLLHSHIMGAPLDRMFRLELDFGAIIRINYDKENSLATLRHL